MNKNNLTRREFLAAASTGTIAAVASGGIPAYGNIGKRAGGKPAILGGKPVRTKSFPGWPVWDRDAEKSVLSILRSGNWFRGRGNTVSEFEKKYAALMGAKRCVCTVNGTNALLTALHVLDIGVGKNRQGAGTDNHIIRGNKRIRRNNNLIADSYIKYVQSRKQSIGSIYRANTALCPH